MLKLKWSQKIVIHASADVGFAKEAGCATKIGVQTAYLIQRILAQLGTVFYMGGKFVPDQLVDAAENACTYAALSGMLRRLGL